jgi:hypothetical protein
MLGYGLNIINNMPTFRNYLNVRGCGWREQGEYVDRVNECGNGKETCLGKSSSLTSLASLG